MKFDTSRTSGEFTEDLEFNTLEELLKFVKEHDEDVVVSEIDGKFYLQIVDDYIA